jgi:hypothetical protein
MTEQDICKGNILHKPDQSCCDFDTLQRRIFTRNNSKHHSPYVRWTTSHSGAGDNDADEHFHEHLHNNAHSGLAAIWSTHLGASGRRCEDTEDTLSIQFSHLWCLRTISTCGIFSHARKTVDVEDTEKTVPGICKMPYLA